MGIFVQAAKCKNDKCGELSAVRQSRSSVELGTIEIPNASRVTEVICVNCGFINVFSDADLVEVFADIRKG
jgi:hypothetical protein